MSQDLTPAQRLTQAEKLLESAIKLSHSNTAKIDALTEKVNRNTESINALTEKVNRNTESIDALTNRVDRLTEQMERVTEMFIDSMGVMREMQTEIRGLQVENRRILDHLFGEESSEN